MVSWDDYLVFLDGMLDGRPIITGTPPQPHQISSNVDAVPESGLFIPCDPKTASREISSAMAQGAAWFLYENSYAAEIDPAMLQSGIPVTNCSVSLQAIAHGWRAQNHHVPIFAIAASHGARLIKDALISILKKLGPVARSGTQRLCESPYASVLQIQPDTRFCVCDLPTMSFDSLNFSVRLIEPDVAVVANMSRSFATEVFSNTPAACFLVANQDDPAIVSAAKTMNRPFGSFGTSSSSSVQLRETEWLKSGQIKCALLIDAVSIEAKIRPANPLYASYVAAAAAAAHVYGIGVKAIQRALASVEFLEEHKIHVTSRHTIIDESEVDDFEQVKAGVQTALKISDGKTKAIVVNCDGESEKQVSYFIRDVAYIVTHDAPPNYILLVGNAASKAASLAKATNETLGKIVHYSKTINDASKRIHDILSSGSVVYIGGLRITGFSELAKKIIEATGVN